jgi:hypothetical protein
MFVAPAVLLAVLRTLHPVDELKQQQQQYQQNIKAWFGNVCAGKQRTQNCQRGGIVYQQTAGVAMGTAPP